MPGRFIGLFAAGQPLIGCQQINSFLKSLGENKLLFNGASAVAVEEQLAGVTGKCVFCHLVMVTGNVLRCLFLHYNCILEDLLW